MRTDELALDCVKCAIHYEDHRWALDSAFNLIGHSRGESKMDTARRYFAGYHDRGHHLAYRQSLS